MILKKGKILNKTRLVTLFSCMLFLFLSGCKSEKEVQRSVPVKAADEVKKDTENLAKKEEEVKETVTYMYDPEGKRDPFKSFIKKQKVEKIEKPKVPLTPLQEYEISQVKLIGIITGASNAEDRAMVADPAGKGYIVKKGTLIGRNFGRVTRIDRNAVIITEDIQDFLGNIITKEIPLTLETEGGK